MLNSPLGQSELYLQGFKGGSAASTRSIERPIKPTKKRVQNKALKMYIFEFICFLGPRLNTEKGVGLTIHVYSFGTPSSIKQFVHGFKNNKMSYDGNSHQNSMAFLNNHVLSCGCRHPCHIRVHISFILCSTVCNSAKELIKRSKTAHQVARK